MCRQEFLPNRRPGHTFGRPGCRTAGAPGRVDCDPARRLDSSPTQTPRMVKLAQTAYGHAACGCALNIARKFKNIMLAAFAPAQLLFYA